jgi:hypothetical protein
MKIEDLFVPYLLAVKLKELGFNEACLGIFNGNFKLYTDTKLEHLTSQEKVQYIFGNDKITVILAPTFEQVFDWFFTKHSLYSSIAWTVNGFDYYIKREPSRIINESHFSSTHRDAQIACINKLIELVNEKTNKPVPQN